MRWLLLPALLCVAAAHAAGAPVELTASQRAQWDTATKYLGSLPAGRALDRSVLPELAKRMPAFDADLLMCAASSDLMKAQPFASVPPIQRGLRSLAYLLRLGGHLRRGPDVALLLGSSRERDWAKAIVEILREPLGERLAPAVEVLARDDHGAIRVGAGRIARYLCAFGGGRGSEWGDLRPTDWDPTPLARRIAAQLLDDRNPAVACEFAMVDAYAFEDPAIVDMLVARLRDRRQRPHVRSGVLMGAERTVGDACRFQLHGHFIFRRQPTWPDRPEPARRRVESLPASDSVEDLTSWWTSVRSRWSFRPDAPGWKTVIDDLVVFVRDRKQTHETPYGPVTLTMTEYGESWSGGQPEFSIVVEARAEVEDLYVHADIGNPRHHLGFVSRGTTGSGGAQTVTSIMFAPENDDGVRARLRIWTLNPPEPR